MTNAYCNLRKGLVNNVNCNTAHLAFIGKLLTLLEFLTIVMPSSNVLQSEVGV